MKIKNIRWDITSKCNLNCEHCQASTYYKENAECKDLSTDQVFSIIDKLSSYHVDKVVLLGGEPLFRKDIIDILKYLKLRKIRASINTNGTLLEKFDINEILENVESVIVSLDGVSEEEHDKLRGYGNYAKTISNVRRLVENRTKQTIGISFVINKYNYKSANKICSLMKDLDVDFCNVDLVHKTGNAEDNWNNLCLSDFEIAKAILDLANSWDFSSKTILVPRMFANRFRDMLFKSTGINLPDKFVSEAPGITSMYILNDGTVVPSQFLAYSGDAEAFKSMSLVDYSLEEIIESNDFDKFLKLYEMKLHKSYYEPCTTCKYSGKQCNPSPVSYWLGRKVPIVLCNYPEEILEEAKRLAIK